MCDVDGDGTLQLQNRVKIETMTSIILDSINLPIPSTDLQNNNNNSVQNEQNYRSNDSNVQNLIQSHTNVKESFNNSNNSYHSDTVEKNVNERKEPELNSKLEDSSTLNNSSNLSNLSNLSNPTIPSNQSNQFNVYTSSSSSTNQKTDKADTNTLQSSTSLLNLLSFQCESILPSIPQPTFHSISIDIPIIHPKVFSLYLRGDSPIDIFGSLKNRQIQELGSTDAKTINQLSNLLYYDVLAQCRIIKSLLPSLEYPKIFVNEDPRWTRQVREKYVKLFFIQDKSVLRELLGKKLSAKERRDLDETSTKTGIPLFACRRMFDNLRDILESVREMQRDLDLSLSELIANQFHFDEDVSKTYAIGVFSCHHQFTIGSRTAWFKDLQYDDLEFCLETIMLHWTRQENKDPLQIDLDLILLKEIRQYLFTHFSKIDQLVKGTISTMKINSKNTKLTHKNLKPIVKNLIWVCGKLNQKKEFRDFLIDICEKFGDLCVEEMNLNADDIYQLCERLIAVFPSILDKKIVNHERLIHTWTLFVIVVRNCLYRILEKSSWYKKY